MREEEKERDPKEVPYYCLTQRKVGGVRGKGKT